jgi:hypothetical protein
MLDNIISLRWICRILGIGTNDFTGFHLFAGGEIRLATNFIKRWIFEAAWTLECHTPGCSAFVVLEEMGEELA